MAVSFLETGVLYREDNLRQLSHFPAECVDLIYLDPPFFSNRNYEVIWGDEAEVRSFEDRWEGGIQHYIGWMRDRVMEMHRVLRPTGSIYLHCDWHASHYLKQMMDEIFGMRHFQNEIVWYYKGAGVSPRRWGRRHDTILYYSKSDDWYFNPDPVRGEYAATTQERFKHYIGNVRKGGDFGPQQLNPRGKHPDDVWEVPIVAPSAKARLGYPTQKPEELLRRVVLASSNVGDVVLDPFAGCGTTLVVAQQEQRKWIGIDISPTAVNVMQQRMRKVGATGVKTVGMPVTVEQLKDLKPFEFQNWVIQRFHGTHSPRKSGDMGIDGYSFMVHDPIQVKQSERVGRNVVDNFEAAMERAGKDKGYIVAFSFGRGAREEVARVRWQRKLEIHLVTVADLLATAPEVLTPLNMLPSLGTVIDLPISPPRPANARPSAEELIASDRSTG